MTLQTKGTLVIERLDRRPNDTAIPTTRTATRANRRAHLGVQLRTESFVGIRSYDGSLLSRMGGAHPYEGS